MNKWIKNGVAGLALSTAAIAASALTAPQAEPANIEQIEAVAVDATDYFGGSKLKDRMVMAQASEQIQMISVMVQS